MKRFISFVLFGLLLTGSVNPAAAQSLTPPMEVVLEDSSRKVIMADLTNDQQYEVNSCEMTTEFERGLRENEDALVAIAENADRIAAIGSEDSIGKSKRSLRICRAENIAEFLNDQLLAREDFPKVEVATFPLSNDAKTGDLTKRQQLLNTRGGGLVVYKNPQPDLSAIQSIQKKIADVRDSNWWQWVLLIALLVALPLLFGYLFSRFGERDTDINEYRRDEHGGNNNGNNDREGANPEPEAVGNAHGDREHEEHPGRDGRRPVFRQENNFYGDGASAQQGDNLPPRFMAEDQ